MKLILKQYLSLLKERGELDAILPDLLRQMGLTVISSPDIGTRQYGVDVAAVGKIGKKGKETIYLLSIKAGDIDRQSWDGGSPQDLRSSLNEILDVYIPTHLPEEHKNKPIIICICMGGGIKEGVRQNITQFENKYVQETVCFQEWNGSKLATMIEQYLLHEKILPGRFQPLLRKSLALIDEPEASFKHFTRLIELLVGIESQQESRILIRTLRQLNVCLWILFAWARDANNLESTYLSAERTLLFAWEISKNFFSNKDKTSNIIQVSFFSILMTYQQICNIFLQERIVPHVNKRDALSFAVQPASKLDVNLKLFDILGRLALAGIWHYWFYQINEDRKNIQESEKHRKQAYVVSQEIKLFINNNPTLLLPCKDDHAIDISLALLLFSYLDKKDNFIVSWLTEMTDQIILSYRWHGAYPCILQSYRDLLEHPKSGNEEYRKQVTASSILYPTIALWAVLLDNHNLFELIRGIQDKCLQHCSFQLWYPDEASEIFLYTNKKLHGLVLVDIKITEDKKSFLDLIWKECDQTGYFNKLTAKEFGILPLVLVACRHYRIPLCPHFALSYRDNIVLQEADAEITE